MNELATKYDPSAVEEKWYAYWMENRLFHSEPDEREPYTIVIPPPNVTGVLHMGHSNYSSKRKSRNIRDYVGLHIYSRLLRSKQHGFRLW